MINIPGSHWESVIVRFCKLLLSSLGMEKKVILLYRARKYGLYVVWWNLFLRAKQQQEQISPNHVQAIFSGSVCPHNLYCMSAKSLFWVNFMPSPLVLLSSHIWIPLSSILSGGPPPARGNYGGGGVGGAPAVITADDELRGPWAFHSAPMAWYTQYGLSDILKGTTGLFCENCIYENKRRFLEFGLVSISRCLI